MSPDVLAVLNGRDAIVTVLIECPQGDQAVILLTLEEGPITGGGAIVHTCAGGLEEVPMIALSNGPAGFEFSPAVAHLEAIVIEEDAVVQDQHWDGDVTISTVP